ncbi:hypothetical protein SAMN05428944_7516 [Streptomyces sp. 1222.5]|nr:hypothetical protein BX260_0574 [Streptomyces sp. 5112.2]SED38836.1 hypothetical protein SAMN05428944_7516 [Streptomyces sp. 1222.5]
MVTVAEPPPSAYAAVTTCGPTASAAPEWFARVARLRSDPKVNRAYRSFSACLAGNDVDADD